MVKAFDRQQAVTNAGHVVVLMGGILPSAKYRYSAVRQFCKASSARV